MLTLRRGALAVLALLLCCVPPRRQQLKLELPELHAKLPNGLRVILLPDPSASLVEVDVRYEVGAAEDPAGKSGLAHVVEHVLFEQRPAGADLPSLYSALAQIAVSFNASTTWDSTHFVSVGRKEDLGTLLAIEAARLSLGCKTVGEDAFARELEVVRNELRERYGDPDALAEARLLSAVYPKGHAYHRPIGGSDEELARLTLADACEFIDDFYTPSRATLIVTGDITADEVKPLLGRYFGALPARAPAARTPVEPVRLTQRDVTLELDVDEPRVSAVFALPPTYDPLGLVGENAAARMQSFLGNAAHRYEFANGFDVSVRGGRLAPVLVATVWLRSPSRAGEALDAIWDAAERAYLRKTIDVLEDEAAQDVVASRRASLIMELESLTARAWRFAEWAQFDPEGEYLAGNLRRLGSIDESEVRALGRALLDVEKAVVVRVKPRAGAQVSPRAARGSGLHAGASREILASAEEARQPEPVPAVTLVPEATHFVLGNGLRVVLAPTPGSLPVMSAKLMFRLGWANDPADRPGLARTATRQLLGPFKDMSRGRKAILFLTLGADRYTEVGPDTIVFSTRGLNIYDELLIEGIERWVRLRLYNSQSLDQLPELTDLDAKNRDLADDQRFEQASAAAIFGPGHPYGRTGALTPASARKMGLDALRSFGETYLTAGNATLVITGSFDVARVEAAVREHFGAWDRGRAPKVVEAPRLERTGPIVLGVAGEARPTVRLRLSYPAPGLDGDHAARLILNELLGQRMAALRQRLAASYGVDARVRVHRAAGAYVMEGHVDAARAGEALRAMRAGVRALGEGDDEVAFAVARRIVLRRLLVAPGTSEGLADTWILMAAHALPDDFYARLVRAAATATPAQVRELVAADLDPRHEVITVLGPRAAVEQVYAEAGLQVTAWVD